MGNRTPDRIPARSRRSKRDVLDVLDTALAKITASEYRPLDDHDREWARAIRYWLAGADDEEAVRRVIQERAGG